MRPVLVYNSSVWDPYPHFVPRPVQSIFLKDELENMQRRTARFVERNYPYELTSVNGILEQLKCEYLRKRRKDSRLIMVCRGPQNASVDPQMTLFLLGPCQESSYLGILNPVCSE